MRIALPSFLAAVVAVTVFFQGCKPPRDMAAANEQYNQQNYFEAAAIYKEVFSNPADKNEKLEAAAKAAESYQLINDNKNAEQWYKKAKNLQPQNAELVLGYAKALKVNEKYTEAITELENYKKTNPGNAEIDKLIKGCELALTWKNEKSRYIVENYKAFNTKSSDFAPMYFKKDELYFTSDREGGVGKDDYGRTGNMYSDLYRAKQLKQKKGDNNVKFEVPALVEGQVNGKFNDGSCAFDKKGGVMYFTRCNGKDGKENNCKIYKSEYKSNVWEEPEVLNFCKDDSVYHYGHPSISDDGRTLYFASDIPGGYGGKDIYMVTYNKKTRDWNEPINLGPEVNTAGHEMYPFLHSDGTLYFSSDGHISIGGLDIFRTTKNEKDEWNTPINMKSPLNSGGDDFAFICDKTKETGWLSSNRIGGKGQDDIYRFYMTPLVIDIVGVITDCASKERLANVEVLLSNNVDSVVQRYVTDEKGTYKFTLAPNVEYEIRVHDLDGLHMDNARPAYPTTRNIEVSTTLTQDFCLDPFNFTDMVAVEGILYDLDKANIRPDAAKILDSLVGVLNRYPNIAIELGSHTDCRQSAEYNRNLAQRRADSAVAYIISRGIDSMRLTAKGYGESAPLPIVRNGKDTVYCTCEDADLSKEREMGRKCTEAEHQLNRRTTVRITSVKYKPAKKEVVDPKKKPGAKPGAPGKSQTTPPKR